MPDTLQFTVDQINICMYASESKEDGQNPKAAIVLLHGAGGNIDFWISKLSPLLQGTGFALYAPYYFDRTGTERADLTTINDGVHPQQWLNTVDAALRFIASRPGVDPNRIVLAGISLGAFLSLALGALLSASPSLSEQRRVRAIISVSGGFAESYGSIATKDFAPTLILHGGKDNIVPVSHATVLDLRLTELDVAHRTEILPEEGHWFSAKAFPRMLLAVSSFLEEHLSPHQAGTPAM